MASRSCHFFCKCEGNRNKISNAKYNGKQLCNGKCNANGKKQRIKARIAMSF
jgi:hypothetical protein